MTVWLLTGDPKDYKHSESFAQNGHIDWGIDNRNLNINDIVYIIYKNIKPRTFSPKIRFKTIVTKTKLKPNEATDDTEFWEIEKPKRNKYFRLQLIKDIGEIEELSFKPYLKKQGLKNVPESAIKLDNQDKIELLSYIENFFDNSFSIKQTDINDEYEKTMLTERESIVKSRIGQDKLRKELLKHKHCCELCGLELEDVLVASHIKPWSESTNDEKLDLDNVILLCPMHDKLFDKGYISFDKNGKIIISNELSEKTQALLNIHDESYIELVSEKKSKFLKYHRQNIFKK